MIGSIFRPRHAVFTKNYLIIAPILPYAKLTTYVGNRAAAYKFQFGMIDMDQWDLIGTFQTSSFDDGGWGPCQVLSRSQTVAGGGPFWRKNLHVGGGSSGHF